MTDQNNKAIVTNSRGRTITFRKLTALDKMRVFEILGPDAARNIPVLNYALTAACVTKIDMVDEAFPLNKIQLEAKVGVLGDEGIEAIAAGIFENFLAGESGELAEVRP